MLNKLKSFFGTAKSNGLPSAAPKSTTVERSSSLRRPTRPLRSTMSSPYRSSSASYDAGYSFDIETDRGGADRSSRCDDLLSSSSSSDASCSYSSSISSSSSD